MNINTHALFLSVTLIFRCRPIHADGSAVTRTLIDLRLSLNFCYVPELATQHVFRPLLNSVISSVRNRLAHLPPQVCYSFLKFYYYSHSDAERRITDRYFYAFFPIVALRVKYRVSYSLPNQAFL